jgi:hypothetical protein
MTEQLGANNQVGIRSERDVRYDQTPAFRKGLIRTGVSLVGIPFGYGLGAIFAIAAIVTAVFSIATAPLVLGIIAGAFLVLGIVSTIIFSKEVNRGKAQNSGGANELSGATMQGIQDQTNLTQTRQEEESPMGRPISLDDDSSEEIEV